MHDLDQQITEVRRELGMRRHVYPKFVGRGKLTQAQADERIAVLESVLVTLEGLRDERIAKVAPQLF
jgi:hypothetical protein